MMGLTRREADLLNFIGSYIARTSSAPTFRQMMAGIGLKSSSGTHRLLAALEERGRIRRLPGRACAIEIVGACTIELPPSLYARIARDARRSGVSVQAHVIDCLCAAFDDSAEAAVSAGWRGDPSPVRTSLRS